MLLYWAADHAGFELKEQLRKLNFTHNGVPVEYVDCGAYEFDRQDDYPVWISRAVENLKADLDRGNYANRAIIIGGSGQGEAFCANRYQGIRAVVYYGEPAMPQTDADGAVLDMITSTRNHNDANVLSLGARFITLEQAQQAVQRWLEIPFSNDPRHERRIEMVDQDG